ncbi:inorganic pyrophosphatase [Lasius niger]|uniref:Inorganic pyrophosphatase n=1 Tax=Lasius niger TaxID=67767 RepID=A0A0J7KU28_LASNI|nr:inorganic pyrophosphatase [Lasius niger]
MDVSKIPAFIPNSNDIHVVIEIPENSRIKYELDKDSGAIMVDRFLFTPMSYPASYGFIPNTLAADGDPADALVLAPEAIVPGAVIRARPVGVLKMEDESGQDEKIICVPSDKIHPGLSHIKTVSDLPKITLDNIKHFFEHYKDLEPNKWVKVTDWADENEALEIIKDSVKQAQK